MRRLPTGLALILLLAGCGGNRGPDVAPGAAPRARCDGFAAQAIQAEDITRAKTLAAQAAQCYAELEGRR